MPLKVAATVLEGPTTQPSSFPLVVACALAALCTTIARGRAAMMSFVSGRNGLAHGVRGEIFRVGRLTANEFAEKASKNL